MLTLAYVVYSTVKLKFPEDQLLSKVITRICENIKDLDPVPTALTVWALAKMRYPSTDVRNLLKSKINNLLTVVEKENYLFDPKDNALDGFS